MTDSAVPLPKTSSGWPERCHFWFRFALCMASGLMLGFSFPPSSLGILACFGLVPLLIVLAEIERTRTALFFSYIAFLVFHVLTLNWTGGYEHGKDVYMMIAGGFTMIIHPLFYFLPISLFLFVRNTFGEKTALVGFPLFWVAYEYSHSLSEWSFPWLTIGNSHSYDLARMQFISFTGVYGLSLLVVVINILSYVLYSHLAQKRWSSFSYSAIGVALLIVVVYLLPKLYGERVLATAPSHETGGVEEGAPTVTVGIVQPNIDPWVKWKGNAGDLFDIYLSMTESLIVTEAKKPDLVLWPETAIPFRLLSKGFEHHLGLLKSRVDMWGTALLTGFTHTVVYDDSSAAPPSAKRTPSTGERYDYFNAAVFLQPDVGENAWYGKMKMVPLAERIPYADVFFLLDFLRWGVGIGGWQIGHDSTIFAERKTGGRFSAMICYESTYPAFVAAFVKKGAEFITIITIDSWWGRMSGAFQHQQFALFRAVENRRWIARCAVGGISCYIDPYGRIYEKTELFTRASMARTIGRFSDLTFYTRHGDWLPVICLFLGGLLFAAAAGKRFKNNQRRLLWDNG